jgi:hypothetical protein
MFPAFGSHPALFPQDQSARIAPYFQMVLGYLGEGNLSALVDRSPSSDYFYTSGTKTSF